MKDEESSLSGAFYVSFDWVLTGPNSHRMQLTYPFLVALAIPS
jgi:hypothetical protein